MGTLSRRHRVLLNTVADRLGVQTGGDAEVEDLIEDVAPEAVLDEVEERRHE